MINFRLKNEEVELVDKYAQMEGLTRSDYIRNALNAALRSSGKGVRLSERSAPQKVEIKTKCVAGNIVNCPAANWQRLATGIKVCTTCGERRD